MTETYRVRHGGLMRCCLETLDNAMVAAVRPPKDGDTLRCAYCKDIYGMVFREDTWQWHNPVMEPKSK